MLCSLLLCSAPVLSCSCLLPWAAVLLLCSALLLCCSALLCCSVALLCFAADSPRFEPVRVAQAQAAAPRHHHQRRRRQVRGRRMVQPTQYYATCHSKSDPHSTMPRATPSLTHTVLCHSRLTHAVM